MSLRSFRFIIVSSELDVWEMCLLTLTARIFFCSPFIPSFYSITSLDSSCKHVFISGVKNSVAPDQLASEKPADLDLNVFKTGYIHVKHGKG